MAKTPGKTRQKKDPNAPKRALSAYMFFSQKNRESIKTKNPNATFGELGKILGQTWKELSEADKKPYLDQAAEDKKRYDKEIAAYKK